MADNLVLMEGSGTLLAADDVDGVHVLRIKVQSGEDGAASDVSSANPLPVAVHRTGLSVFRAVGLGASAQVAKDGPGRVYGWHLANTGTSGVFVKLYDAAEVPEVGVDTPTATLFVPSGSAISSEQPNGIVFANGISVAATTGAAVNNTGAPTAGSVIVDLFHADIDVTDAEAGGSSGSGSGGVAAATPNTVALRDSTGRLSGSGYDAALGRVVQVGAPVASTDATTKAYVDTAAAALTPQTRALRTVPPLAIDGDVVADLSTGRTLTISAATTSAAGSMSAADKARLDGLKVPIGASVPTSTAAQLTVVYVNDTAAAVTVSGIGFMPTDSISADDSNAWKIQLTLSSAPGTALLEWDTKASEEGALSAGTRVTLAGGTSVSVPAGQALILRLVVAVGSPGTLGGRVQGYIPI